MKILSFFPETKMQQNSLRFILLIAVGIGAQAYVFANPLINNIPLDSVPRLPCYNQLEKDMFRSGFTISAHAKSIQGGIIDFIAAGFANHRKFKLCLNERYPYGNEDQYNFDPIKK